MRRIAVVLFVLTIFLGMMCTAFAEKQEGNIVQITDGLSQNKKEVYSVNLLMNQKNVVTDVPAVLYNNRTLVPIRFVVENLGAEIAWDQETYTATIKTKDKTIVLKINSATAYVNKEKITLPDKVPAKLLGYQDKYRTMVPLRFISEQLGMNVDWVPETTTATVDFPKQSITGIQYDKSNPVPKMIIKTTGKVAATPLYLQGSKYGGNDRLVLDIPNTVLDMDDAGFKENDGLMKKDIKKDGILAIRASLFEPEPKNITRVVVDLETPKGYNINYSQNEIQVEFLNSVKNIALEKKNNADVVVIHAEEPPVYKTMDLGDRFVVDVLNANLKFDQSQISVSRNGVSRIRVGEFTPDMNYNKNDKIVRVVLDLEAGQHYENMFIDSEGNDILIYMNNKPLKGLDYHKETFTTSVLKLSLEDEVKHYIDYDKSSRKLTVEVPKDAMDLSKSSLKISDNMVASIKIEDEDDKYYEITLNLLEGVDYVVETEDEKSDEVIIRFENKKISGSPYRGKLVVIDAGHGGKDPGAHSVSKTLQEKKLALDTAQRLKKLLEEAGFKTVMTRTDDRYIGLYDRADIANRLNADAFVSIHYNWHPDKAVTGVQVLYNGDDPLRDNKTFARIAQEEMTKELNAVDKGIIHRPNLVVIRETNMPAILAEMAFISNATEEVKVSMESYRQKCAQALYNGITRYFDEVLLK
ncbi:N-acetylmuramoyl-L-alanine amidase family protein [Clostridiaceae bacterium 35-E11]